MKCDTCGWRTSKKDYDGDGECLRCFEGQMIQETGRPRKLPTVKLDNGKTYFIDERLRQLRNVDNPHDFIDFNQG